MPLSQLRRFSLTAVRNNSKHSDTKKQFEHELAELKKLKRMYGEVDTLRRFALRPAIAIQLRRVLNALPVSSGTDSGADACPPIKFPDDPLDPKIAPMYAAEYSFMLEAFVDQCQEYRSFDLAVDPDTIIDQLESSYSLQYPSHPPLNSAKILEYFHLYYALLNTQVFLDELRFENNVVADMLKEYSALAPHDSKDDAKVKCVSKHKIDRVTVDSWFAIFDTLSEVPFASGTSRNTCALCPREYETFKRLELEWSGYRDILNGKPELDSPKKSSKADGVKTFELNITPTRLFQIGIIVGLTLVLLSGLVSASDHSEITFQEFTTNFLARNLVDKLVVSNNKVVYVELNAAGKAQFPSEVGRHYFNIGLVETFERQLREAQDQRDVADALRVPVLFVSEGNTTKMLATFLPTVLFLGAIFYMTKKAGAMGGMGGPMGFGKSTAKKFNQETDVTIRFKDVAGMAEAKQEVMEFVNFLKNPKKYERLGAKIPRGAILSGPPGTGKTLIARATAGEAGVPFYSVSGSEFVEMFVGVGASRVRDLFKTARENAPSIVFVDEIDAIGKQRSKGNASGANDERETTLNQLLVEMDGFDSTNHVVVLAGTNRPDTLDKALMRPGRFDRHISIDNPEMEGRKEIFAVHLRKIALAPNIDRDLPGRLAALTPGFSGADIANVCNEAALIAARFNANDVQLRHFELAIERVIGGVEKKSKVLSAEEQRIVAYHEAGHAVCGWFLEYAYPLLKVLIIPRGLGTLGYAQYLPPDQYLMSAKQLEDRMVMTLGGRVSEELHFNSVTSGAHDDFKKVTSVAQLMVLRFGMSEKVGMVNYADTQSQDNLTKPFSDETGRLIDEEIKLIVRAAHARCKALLSEKSEAVELVAQELLKKEFITREDMIRLLGKRPFAENNDAFDKYLAGGEAAFKNEPSVGNDSSSKKDGSGSEPTPA